MSLVKSLHCSLFHPRSFDLWLELAVCAREILRVLDRVERLEQLCRGRLWFFGLGFLLRRCRQIFLRETERSDFVDRSGFDAFLCVLELGDKRANRRQVRVLFSQRLDFSFQSRDARVEISDRSVAHFDLALETIDLDLQI